MFRNIHLPKYKAVSTPNTLNAKSAELVTHMGALTRRFILQPQLTNGPEQSLTKQEFRTLMAVGDLEAGNMRELALRTTVAVSSLTGIVDRLVDKQLAARIRSDKDRRVVRVKLTAAGRRLYKECRGRRLRMARAMLGALNGRERDVLLELFRKIRSTLPETNSRTGAKT